MNNYSVTYLNIDGHTSSSELLPFDDNRAAIAFARIGLVRSAIVEVWRNGDLVARLQREGASEAVAGAAPADSSIRILAGVCGVRNGRSAAGGGTGMWPQSSPVVR